MQRFLRRLATFGSRWSFAAQDAQAGGAANAPRGTTQPRLVVFEGIYSCD